MDEQTQERALEPFFTTKSSVDGTGLGLSTVHGAIKGAGGYVTIDSALGRGTEVHLFLPVTEERPMESGGDVETALIAARILVAEDEGAVRRVATRALEGDGHEVIGTSDGAGAWARFQEQPDRFDLVVTDAVMPHMSGLELVRRVREVSDDMLITVMTGYTEEELDEDIDRGDVHFLEKPFTLHQLRSTVRKLLRQAQAGGP